MARVKRAHDGQGVKARDGQGNTGHTMARETRGTRWPEFKKARDGQGRKRARDGRGRKRARDGQGST